MAEHLAPSPVSLAAEVLSQLPADSWVVLHDLHLATRRTPVAHVLVGPPGVQVVTSAAWQGQVRERDVRAAADVAAEVTALLGSVLSDDVRPVLCYETEEFVDAWSEGVVVASAATVVELSAARRAVLEPTEVRRVAAELTSLTSVARHGGSHRRALEKPRRSLRLLRHAQGFAPQR